MPLFRCSECGCVENTAFSDFWLQRDFEKITPKCSECRTGKWHERFPKRSASGYLIDQEGFLWSGNDPSAKPTHIKIVSVVP